MASEKQIKYLQDLVKKVFNGQSWFLDEFNTRLKTIKSDSISVMISGLKQELNLKKLPYSMRYNIFTASNMNDFAVKKFMNEYNKYIQTRQGEEKEAN